MRLIDADALFETLVTGDIRETQQFCYPCKKVLEAIDAQPTVEAISREAALDALTDDLSYYGSGAAEAVGMARAMGIIERLPGGEKTQLSEESTTNATDCISRQAALEAMDTWDKFGCDPDGKLVRYDDDKHYVPYVHYEDMVHAVKNLPSQPETHDKRTETHACDLIDRQAAIDALGDMVMNWTDSDYELGQLNQWKADRKAIIDLPSAQPKWIPVTDRLPEENKEVLICTDDGILHIAEHEVFFDRVYWEETTEYRTVENVVAWMPLPDPWKGE